LFELLNHDNIQYPSGLGGYMAWLWDEAEDKNLSDDEIQAHLEELAVWVRLTEKNAPQGGIWEQSFAAF
jgi:hypothetical protein